ncbi:MAG: hypothetical protein ACFNUJ_06420, partial [Campylobacter curvus]
YNIKGLLIGGLMRIFTVKFFIYLLTSDGKRKRHLDNNHKARFYLTLLIISRHFGFILKRADRALKNE